jgi:hypothetical protein
MNARMERAINSENLGTRNAGNRALDQKIWALEVLGPKQSFEEVLGHFGNVRSGWRALVQKDRDLCEIWGIFRDFSGIGGFRGV